MCVVLPDTGIDATQYVNANCTGTSNTFSVLITSAVLDYQVVGTTRRFVLWVTASPAGTIPIPIFFGAASFDARQCANYSIWPLVIPNGLSSTACLSGGMGRRCPRSRWAERRYSRWRAIRTAMGQRTALR